MKTVLNAIVTGPEPMASYGRKQTRRTMFLEEVLIPIALFATIFGIVYITVTSRHRQRMAMIEKGMDLGDLKDKEVPFRNLRNGLFMMAVGLGLFLGYLMDTQMVGFGPDGDMGDTPLPYFIMVLLCGGLALVAHHIIVSRKQKS